MTASMTRCNPRKMMVTILVLAILVMSFISTINLHSYASTPVQTLRNDIDNPTSGNWSSIETAASSVPTRVDTEDVVDLDNIPAFMKDYFEWHGKQLQQMEEDAKISGINGNDDEEDDAYLGKYRFLVLRCASSRRNGGGDVVEDRCGGLSDRMKPFPLFLWYASTTNRILFIRWGKNRPAPIETFMVPGNHWNWTFPDALMRKIEKLEESDDASKNHNENFSRMYFDGLEKNHQQMLAKIGDPSVWMIEGNDFTGGRGRYESFVKSALEKASQSNQDNPESDSVVFSTSTLRPGDALYENFYHDLFHATFRPSTGVQNLLDAYFYAPEDNVSSQARSWLPVPLQRNQYAVAQYRATYPREPYKLTQDRTILRETAIHAVECAKSRVGGSNTSNIYVTSDTALAIEAVRDKYRDHNSMPSEGNTDPVKSMNVWTYLDLQSYDTDAVESGVNKDGAVKTKPAITLAEDPPHLNFAKPDHVSAFYVIFVDLFLMSYATCVVYGAGGFGRMGSLVSYRPLCGIAYSVNHGKLQHCNPYD